MNFEIIGRVKGNIHILKNVKNKYNLSVYNDSMILLDKKNMDFISSKAFNIDYVTYPDFFYLVYQYQRKRILYCMGVKIDGNGNMLDQPMVLDTTEINLFADNKIYSVVNSEDKKHIAIFKLLKKNDHLNFTTLLFDSKLTKVGRSNFILPFNDRTDVYNNFQLDNDGNIVFVRSSTAGSSESIDDLQILVKSPLADTLVSRDVDLEKYYLDDIKLKVDNTNKHYVVNSFYNKQKRGNIEGVFSLVLNKQLDSILVKNYLYLDDEIRALAKQDATNKTAFNNYFIKNIIVKKDGGFIIIAEDFYTQVSGANNWNRWNNLYSPYYNPYNYYYDPFYRSMYNYNQRSNTKYIYNNIMTISYNNSGQAEWSRIIERQQFDADTDNFLSFINFNTSGQIHFFYNLLERKKQLLTDYSITPDGTVTRNPTFKMMAEGYEFMPQYGKQVSSRQIVLPCVYHNNVICFAKIDY
ncbi:MAG: hypothetical protein V4556_14575 [Bacteroidota bacterium]